MRTRHSIPFDPALTTERPFEVAEGAAAAEAMMDLVSPPIALFCANNIQALGAMFTCQRLGVHIPGDISIIGFDDLPITRFVNPPLSTVHVPAQEMGEAAADALISAVDADKPIQSFLIEARVIIRNSTKSLHS